MKRISLSLVIALSLVAGLIGTSAVATAKGKKKKPAGHVVVATDAADDWGSNVDEGSND